MARTSGLALFAPTKAPTTCAHHRKASALSVSGPRCHWPPAAGLQADLPAKGGQAAQDAVASTAGAQQTLKLAGFWNGPLDGN